MIKIAVKKNPICVIRPTPSNLADEETNKILKNPYNSSGLVYRLLDEDQLPNCEDKYLYWDREDIDNANLLEMDASRKAKKDADLLAEAKTTKISQINEESFSRLEVEYPSYVQRNAGIGYFLPNGNWFGVYDQQKTENIRLAIILQKQIVETLTTTINACTTIEEVNQIVWPS